MASAAVLAPVALACVWFGGPAWTALVVVCAVTLGLEWAALCGSPPRSWPGVTVPATTAAAACAAGAGRPAAALVLVAVATLLALPLGRWIALGIAYLGVPVVALWVLRAGPGGRLDVMFLLGVVWASDIGAYFAGRALGGPKLAPAISPGKTRSGAVGGLVAAVAFAAAMAAVLAPGAVPLAAVLAAALSVASQAGDLFESWVKRRFGAKDSGRLIPGHGGVLDRLDGLLAAAPVLALVTWAGQGGVSWR